MEKRYISKVLFCDPIMSCYEIIDTETGSSFLVCEEKKTINTIVNLLNKQDEEIKNNANALRRVIKNCGTAECDLKNSKAIEALEKVIDFIRNNETVPMYWDIAKFVNIQITELRGGE